MAPTASAESAAIASSTTRSSTASPLSGPASTASGPTRDGRQRHVGGAHAVLRGIAAAGDAVGLGVDQEQADAAAVGAAALRRAP